MSELEREQVIGFNAWKYPEPRLFVRMVSRHRFGPGADAFGHADKIG